MDTSKEYIKMCEKAEEIQALSPRKRYAIDLYAFDGGIHTYDLYRPEEYHCAAIWLPRQDQLQEMVESNVEIYTIVYLDKEWYLGDGYGGIERPSYPSAEQLWLAFVMEEKYNKIWNGEDWEVK